VHEDFVPQVRLLDAVFQRFSKEIAFICRAHLAVLEDCKLLGKLERPGRVLWRQLQQRAGHLTSLWVVQHHVFHSGWGRLAAGDHGLAISIHLELLRKRGQAGHARRARHAVRATLFFLTDN